MVGEVVGLGGLLLDWWMRGLRGAVAGARQRIQGLEFLLGVVWNCEESVFA